MRILVLHKHRFFDSRLSYERAIDHDTHAVTYAGPAASIAAIPDGLRCKRLAWNSEESALEEIRAEVKRHGNFERVIARHEDMILLAATLRDELGIQGMKARQAEPFRDKVLMKERVAEAGIKVPTHCLASAAGSEQRWLGRTVFKPCDGSGSEGVKVFPSFREAAEFVARQTANAEGGSPLDGCELEEFIEGDLWHVDGFLFQGKPVEAQASRYIGTGLSFAEGSPLGSVQHANPDLVTWAIDCLHALGADTLSFHLEAIVTSAGPVFLEVAARCGGCYIVDMFERRHGIQLQALDIATEVDGKLATRFITGRRSDLTYGFFAYPGHIYGGAPCEIVDPVGLLRDSCIVQLSRLPPGVPPSTTQTYRPESLPLAGMISAADSAAGEAWLRSLFDKVKVRSAAVSIAET